MSIEYVEIKKKRNDDEKSAGNITKHCEGM